MACLCLKCRLHQKMMLSSLYSSCRTATVMFRSFRSPDSLDTQHRQLTRFLFSFDQKCLLQGPWLTTSSFGIVGVSESAENLTVLVFQASKTSDMQLKLTVLDTWLQSTEHLNNNSTHFAIQSLIMLFLPLCFEAMSIASVQGPDALYALFLRFITYCFLNQLRYFPFW